MGCRRREWSGLIDRAVVCAHPGVATTLTSALAPDWSGHVKELTLSTKPLSMNEIRHRSGAFVAEWRAREGYERGEGQEFVRDLLAAFGLTKSKTALYEKRAKRSSSGGRGYIDALIPGLAAVEMKSPGNDLAAAERQALDYIDSLTEAETPRWIITSDFRNFRVLDIEAADGHDTVCFTLDQLPTHTEDLAFLAGYQTRSFGTAEQEKASVEAAQLMASLYIEVEKAGLDDHEASVFLVRTLFCLYADDSGLWERDLFYEFLETRTTEDGSDLGSQLSQLYQVLDLPSGKRPAALDELLARFPYVNGGLFGEALTIPYFDRTMRDKLIRCCAFNWATISPAVFGSLFQAVKSPEARRQLGEHYTTETNILKLIGPLFLDELRQRFADNVHSKSGLTKLLDDLSSIRVLDPAAGCGNFLVCSMRELRSLELDLYERLEQLDPRYLQGALIAEDLVRVRLGHFRGIEIEEWPARIAATALYLVQHQANQRMELSLGMAPDPLPLVPNDAIRVGNALHMDWDTILPAGSTTYVVSNPPFIGQYTKNVDQSEDTQLVWGNQYDGYLDYVTCWYKKAVDYFGPYRGGRFAFVSTNSVAQGQPVSALFGMIFAAGWRIKFAHQTFPWTSEAPGMAHVHCVIIGFDREPKSAPPVLYRYPDPRGAPVATPVNNINGYLIDGPNLFVTKRARPASPAVPPVLYGSKPADGGGFTVDPDEIAEVQADPVAAKYLRPFVGSRQLLHGAERWCLWLVDLDPRDIQRSAILHDRLEKVRMSRFKSTKRHTREAAATPQLFTEIRQPSAPYLCIPIHVSQNRKWFTAAWFGPEVICSNANFTADDPDGYLFGLISSAMFITWQRMVGGRIKSDLRFSNTIVWNNLPLPVLDEATRERIIAGGRQVLAARELHPHRSLDDAYNPLAMDLNLVRAHQALDRVVDRAFGAKSLCDTEADREALLFKNWQRLSGAK